MRKPRLVNRCWFKKVRREFSRVAMPFAGQPITYVEVGVWRGDSALWVCENILTHKDSRGFGIDPWLPGHNYGQEIADDAMRDALGKVTKAAPFRFELIRQKSQEVFKYARFDSAIDLLYLDGAHDAHSVMLDFCGAWPMLKTGSCVIFDDYSIGERKGPFHVRDAVHAIMMSFGRWVEEISKGLQFAMRVKEMPELGAICK
jgi:predicted O-methyltransferase YrrM